MGDVALSDWFKVRLVFKSGQVIELHDDGKLGLVDKARKVFDSTPITTLVGLRATPLVIKVEVALDPSELAAVEIVPCDHLTWTMKPSDLESASCGTSLS